LEYEQVYDCLFSNPGKLCHDLMLIRARKHLSSMPIQYWAISNTFCIYFLLTLHILSVQGQRDCRGVITKTHALGKAGLYADEHATYKTKNKCFESYRGVYGLDCPEDLKIPPLTWVAAVFMRQSL